MALARALPSLCTVCAVVIRGMLAVLTPYPEQQSNRIGLHGQSTPAAADHLFFFHGHALGCLAEIQPAEGNLAGTRRNDSGAARTTAIGEFA